MHLKGEDLMGYSMDLAALLSPQSVEDFVKKAWARCPFIVRADRPDRFKALFDIAEFEFLAGTVAAPGWLSFVKDTVEVPAREQLTSDGTLNSAALYKSVSEGRSLLLTRVHRLHAATGALCRQVAADFRAAGVVLRKPVRANAYFTPPSAKGFDAHYDDHDVLVLQLAGTKRWRIFGEAVRWPRKPMLQPLPAEFLAVRPQEITLQTGDVLYLPRGFVHEAVAEKDSSLHLTLSVQAATWSDVFESLMDRYDQLGEPLPVGFGAGGVTRPSDRARADELGRGLLGSPGLDRAVQDICNSTFAQGDLPGSGLLARLGDRAGITSQTPLIAVAGLSARVEEQEGAVALRLPGAVLRADRGAVSLFRRVCSGEPFRLAELGNAVEAQALVDLAEELVKRGILIAAPH